MKGYVRNKESEIKAYKIHALRVDLNEPTIELKYRDLKMFIPYTLLKIIWKGFDLYRYPDHLNDMKSFDDFLYKIVNMMDDDIDRLKRRKREDEIYGE